MVNTKRLAGIIRSLCAAAFAAGLLPNTAFAVSWQWSAVPQGGRERVTITLDSPNQQATTSRDGTQSLRVELSPAGATLTAPQSLPRENALVQGLSLTDGTLSLSLSAPSFGFIASRPAPNRVVVEIYRDPIGARWQPDGRLAPPTAATPTTPTAAAPVTAVASTTAPVQTLASNTPPPPAALIPQSPASETVSELPPTPPAANNESTVTAQVALPPVPEPVSQDADNAAPLASAPSLASAETPAAITQPADSTAGATNNTATVPVQAETDTDAASTSAPAVQQNMGLPTPTVRARLNLQGPDAWASSQILPPSALANSAAAPRPQEPQIEPQLRTSLRDVSKENAPMLDVPPPATQESLSPTLTVDTSTVGTLTEDASTPQTPGISATHEPMPAVAAQPATVPPTQAANAGSTLAVPADTTSPTTVSQNTTLNVTAPTAQQATPSTNMTPPTSNSDNTNGNTVTPAQQNPTEIPGAASINGTTGAVGATSPASSAAQTPAATPATAPIDTTVATPANTNSNAHVDTPTRPETSSAPVNSPASAPEPSPSLDATALPHTEAPATATSSADMHDAAANLADNAHDTKTESDGTKDKADDKKNVEGATADKDAPPALQPVYVDEQGNPVPPPPDVPALLASSRAHIRKARYAEALPDLQILKKAELTKEEREEVLYNIMTALFETSHNDLASKAEETSRAAQEAMNFNLDSMQVPDALNVLSRVELAQGNLADAQGYVMLMKKRYPFSPQVSTALLALGEEQMQKQNYADATLTFQSILQDYPESKVAKDAARLQTYSLYRQGHMQRALTLIDFVQRRWPRLYLEDPNFLTMTADIETRQNRLFNALNTYWTLYNLNPTSPDSASTLYKISELYYALNYPEAAAKVLDEIMRAFPKSSDAPKALLRLGENGVYDGNLSLDEILAIFEKPNPRLPGIYYQRIIQEYPDSPEALTARLRLIAWQLRNRETLDAMNAARSFMIDYEDKPESLRARDILLRGFALEMGKALAEENFERVLSLWERFPQVHDYYQPLEPDLRVALARAQLNRGKEVEGMELLAPFLNGPQDTKYGLYVFNLYLAAHLRQQNWDGLLSLGEKVEKWALPKESRDQLDYTLALSAENLGLQSRALPLWQKLAPKTDIPLFQRAYASYFLARDAERRQDLRAAYQYNLDALGMFTQLQDDQSPYADSERIRESIAALMDVTEIAGRFAESLDWANKYAIFVPETSPDYAGLRFREARLHRKMGDMARWRAILQGIIDKEPDSVFGKMAASELHTQDVARDLTRFTGQ